MNDLLAALDLSAWKPILSALLLPPVPLLLLLPVGVRVVMSRRWLGWLIVLLSVSALWLSMCTGIAYALQRSLLNIPPALSVERIKQLRAEARTGGSTAIVVLGGGLEPLAPEYGTSNLRYRSLERLRYALWLSRETGLPVAFSGGAGWAQPSNASEAGVAARIAAQDFGRPLRWTEEESRDTRENAGRTVPLLKRSGVTHIVLVTHGWHMPRAQRAFNAAAAASGMRVDAAPMGLATQTDRPALDWLPSDHGYSLVRNVLREWLGQLLSA